MIDEIKLSIGLGVAGFLWMCAKKLLILDNHSRSGSYVCTLMKYTSQRGGLWARAASSATLLRADASGATPRVLAGGFAISTLQLYQWIMHKSLGRLPVRLAIQAHEHRSTFMDQRMTAIPVAEEMAASFNRGYLSFQSYRICISAAAEGLPPPSRKGVKIAHDLTARVLRKRKLVDSLNHDLAHARRKRDTFAASVTTLTEQIAELEARLSAETQRRARERAASVSVAIASACNILGLRVGDDPAAAHIAETVIKFAQRGVRTPMKLRRRTASRSVRHPPLWGGRAAMLRP
jgi:hypothetical protein